MRTGILTLLILTGLLGLSVSGCQSESSRAVNSTAPAREIPAAETTPDGASNLSASHRITFESADKVQIVGSFFASSKSNSPAVLLLHQFQSDRHSYDDFAKRLQAKGFGVLAIDGRGFGESVKTTDGENVAVSRSDEAVKGMKSDVAAAFEFLAKQQNVEAARIGIVGASYGSSLAIIYAADNPKVKAIALLSPGLNYFGNMPTKPAVEKFGDRPLYLIAALDDKESAAAVEMLNPFVGNRSKHLQTIHPSGGHGTALLKVGATEELEDFLSKNL